MTSKILKFILSTSFVFSLSFAWSLILAGCGSSQQIAPAPENKTIDHGMSAEAGPRMPEHVVEQLANCQRQGVSRAGLIEDVIHFRLYVIGDGRPIVVYVSKSSLNDRDAEACMSGALLATSWPMAVALTERRSTGSSDPIRFGEPSVIVSRSLLAQPAQAPTVAPPIEPAPTSGIRLIRPPPVSNPTPSSSLRFMPKVVKFISPVTVFLTILLYSPDLNSGEDEAIRRREEEERIAREERKAQAATAGERKSDSYVVPGVGHVRQQEDGGWYLEKKQPAASSGSQPPESDAGNSEVQLPDPKKAQEPETQSAGTPAELKPYGGPGGGHHVPAKRAFEGAKNYDPDEALAIPNEELKRLGIDHIGVLTPAQRSGYQAFAKTGKPLTWEAIAKIETDALVKAGMKIDMAQATVAKAIKALKERGVAGPVRVPWGK